ncbi:TonB-dependent receptor [Caulobacter flavus]|uniref:TonB-dependent receptor n=1 Tax=Caulobacter flavus TaxID=1679497 RepID=A0A2N5CQH1_9CAUL|nr:TonB-dependent receptor [Caulobacter flavus]AYV48699.1 TonB-dependent receptor [Caulobacter flavus]PLR10230.1 TonB-dependent receptor [Caulobacter flavus]
MKTTISAQLRASASRLAVAAVLLSAPAIAHAQTAPDAGQTTEPEAVEEVVVTGIRASLRSAMDVKRNSLQVVDSISAEDIGDFPDKNLSEALQRVTGVQISRQDGEGRGVSIRGADPSLNRVEINGSSALSLTVGGGDRAVDFRDIPVEFVSRLDVVKSPTADMAEGGIGGTVRVITRRPFDSNKPFVAGSIQGVYSNLAKEYDPKLALIGSRTFFNDTLGVLLSGTWENRHLNSNNARTTGWLDRAPAATGINSLPNRSSDVNGDGKLDFIPDIPRYIIDRRETERKALSTVVEWRPTDNFKAYFDATYATANEQVNSSFLQLSGNSGAIDYSKTTLGDDNTVNHIELVSATDLPIDLAYRNILGNLERTQYTTAVGGEWKLDKWVFDARFDYSNAEVQNNEINSTATVFGVPRAVIDYKNGKGSPNMSFPGLDVTTGQGVKRIDALFNPRNNTSEETAQQFNITYKPEGSWLTSIKAGVQARQFETDQILYQRTTRLNCQNDGSSGAIGAVNTSCATLEEIVNINSTLQSVPFFKTGDLGYSGGIRQWNDNTMATYAATLAVAGRTNDVYAVNPNRNTAARYGDPGTYQAFLDTWSVEEKTRSAYVQANFEFHELRVPISGTLGVRVVDTETLSKGYNRVQTGTTPDEIVNFVPGEEEGGYTKTLPSLNLRAEFIPGKLIGRAAASKVMARAAPAQLALRRSIDQIGFTGSRGNPDLQPFEATAYDAGLEWYFNRESFVSATYFRKEISSFIINQTTPEVIDGQTYAINRPINGTDEVTIDGLEVGGQYAFDFLPGPFNGLGVLANFTYQKDKGFKGTNRLTNELLPFPGLSRKSYNVSLYYENDKVSARASYNWRGDWLITPTGRGNLPEFNKAFGTLDVSASYNVNDNITVFVEGVNLTDEVRQEYNADARQIGNETFGSRYFFGVRAKF